MTMRDRTLLASLAFADADKADSLHDLGCTYVTLPHVFNQMRVPNTTGTGALVADVKRRPEQEVPISKGSGQYKTTIGFIDAIVPAVVNDWTACYVPFEVKIGEVSIGDALRQIALYREYIYMTFGDFERIRLTEAQRSELDVCTKRELIWKTNEVCSKAASWSRHFVLACAFEMSPAFINSCVQNDIFPVRLGDGFRRWVSEQSAVASPRIVEV